MSEITVGRGSAAVVAVATLVYLNSLWNGFALDDVLIIEANARVHDVFNQADIWLTPYWPIYGQELGLYRPAAVFGYAVQWALGGGAPWLFHATSLLLHVGVSLLVFQLLRVLTATAAAALAGALIFAVHPVHVEAVANIVGQAELIAAAALLGGVLLGATRPAGARFTWSRTSALCLLYLAGLLAKESVIVLPALIITVDAVQGRIRAAGGPVAYGRAVGMPLFLLTAILAAVLLLRFEVLDSLVSAHIAPGLPFLRGDHRILVALSAIPEVFRLLIFPIDLSSDYAPAVIRPVSTLTPMVVIGGLLLVSSVALALLALGKPHVGLPAAWLTITMLPVSNLFFPIGAVVAERLLYVPSVAVALAIGYGWSRVASHTNNRRPAAAYALAAVVVLLGIRSIVRNSDWRDSSTVLAALVRDHPESFRAQYSAGSALLASHPVRAREYLELAYRTWQDDPFLLSQIGRLELVDGDIDRAVVLLEKSRALAPFVHETESSLAFAYIASGRTIDALRALDRAHGLGADPVTTFTLRAMTYEAVGQYGPAAGAWQAAARRDTAGNQTWKLLARSLAIGGWRKGALAAVDSARSHARDDEDATVVALDRAIRAGCYAESQRAGPRAVACADPLADAIMVLPGQAAR